MDRISPKYQMNLIKDIDKAIWKEYPSYKEALMYILKWHEEEQEWNNFWENFPILYKDEERKNIDIFSTLHSMDGELLLKIAIDLGLETPDFIPSIPTFRNEIKSSYPTASSTFEKAFRNIENNPSIAIGLANSALESIIKEILKDNRIKTKWKSNDTLYKLIQGIIKEFSLFPNSDMPEEIRQISSSLLSLSQSIERLRSEKTEFHGKTDDDIIITEPLYVYLSINSICSIGLFLLSYYKKKFPKLEIENNTRNDENELPF
jgi:hypothetical protein